MKTQVRNITIAAGAACATALVALAPRGADAAPPSWAEVGDTLEKCAGIVLAGQNDCGANGHDCSGHAAEDNDPNEWVYMPAGVCERITGARVIQTKVVEAES